MRLQTGGVLGLHMDNMDGTLDLLWNITDVIPFTSPKLRETELWKQLIFSRKNHTAISLTPRSGNSRCSGYYSRSLMSTTCWPIMSGWRRTNTCLKTPLRDFRRRHTTKNKNYCSPHQKREQQCTSEGAYTCLTSEGAKHNGTAYVSSAQNANTLNYKFTSTTKNICNTSSHNTNTTCDG
jgi:hypothetical protein